ncbi:MAG: RNA pyrophosphohydrolase [Pseudomonadota bacterium]
MIRASDRESMPYRPCVGIVVFNVEGKVWAGRRIQNSETPSDYRWQLPQGGIDKGEDPLPAAQRELYEETGMQTVSLLGETAEWLNYDLPDDILGIGLKGRYRGQTQKWFAFRFEGDEAEINISEPPDGSHPEFDQWAWKDLSEMPGLIVPFKRGIYERLVTEFESFSG